MQPALPACGEGLHEVGTERILEGDWKEQSEEKSGPLHLTRNTQRGEDTSVKEETTCCLFHEQRRLHRQQGERTDIQLSTRSGHDTQQKSINPSIHFSNQF